MNKKNKGCLFILFIVVTGIIGALVFNNAGKQTNESPKKTNDTIFSLKVEQLNRLQLKDLSSLKKVDEHPLYTMNYSADYHFDDFLLRGVPTAVGYRFHQNTFTLRTACTSFSSRNPKGQAIFAHNSDAPKYPKLLVFTTAFKAKRYASAAMVNINLLGYESNNPQLDTMKRRIGLLDAPYYAQEGMNEKGVAIAIKGIKGYRVYHPGKITLTGLHIVRLVLDYAGNLEEAVELIKKYNNLHSHQLHYMIADASGQSAVVEYIGSDVKVIPNQETWQVASNRLIDSAGPKDPILSHCNRYKTAYNLLEKKHGIITANEAMNILRDVSQKRINSTHWSAVYNLNTGSIIAVLERKFEIVKSFHLKMY
jgi:Linear amide C-N hydrolases, choloylglycine hydrolase family